MFLVWQDVTPAHPQHRTPTCPHEGAASVWKRPMLVETQGRNKRHVVCYLGTTFRSCCTQDAYARGVWWRDHKKRLSQLRVQQRALYRRVLSHKDKWLPGLQAVVPILSSHEKEKFRYQQSKKQPKIKADKEGKGRSKRAPPKPPQSDTEVAAAILHVSWPCSVEELKGALKKRAFETHPDKGGSTDEMRAVLEAYGFLRSLQLVWVHGQRRRSTEKRQPTYG